LVAVAVCAETAWAARDVAREKFRAEVLLLLMACREKDRGWPSRWRHRWQIILCLIAMNFPAGIGSKGNGMRCGNEGNAARWWRVGDFHIQRLITCPSLGQFITHLGTWALTNAATSDIQIGHANSEPMHEKQKL
jgi:hypothetical protein